MLDSETKRRIDTARDILVGKIPDPKSQIEQITIALIYKFMDDMDKKSEELGGKPKFFTGTYSKYAWNKILDRSISGFELVNLYGESIQSMNQNPNLPQLFRDIFKNAYLPYRDPETLRQFLRIIDDFKYDHSEKLGDAFEYLLSVMGSQGDAGQFRTPRHIIDFIVDVVDPSIDNTILDPACGTAGFLISAYKHIIEKNTKDGKLDLKPAERKELGENIVGYDISPDMVRLSLVNLYLHGFKSPRIYEYDSLTSDEKWNETFDVALANPPFMTPKGGIRPHKRFSVDSNRAEVLFVDYIHEHLNNDGKAGIVVPEGIIFQSGTAYKSLRKMLVDKSLYAVVSLPAGVFNPYSGVKTSVLFLDKKLAKKTSNILFVKAESDGYGLGAQRREVKENDLTEALTILQEYKKSLLEGKEFKVQSKIAHIVSKEVIGKSGDYNLSGDRYKEIKVYDGTYELVELGEVAELIGGYAFKSEESKKEKLTNHLPIIKIGNVDKSGKLDLTDVQYYEYNDNLKKYLIGKDDILIAMTGATVGKVAISQSDNLMLNQRVGLIRIKQNVSKKYIKCLLLNELFYEYCQKTAGGGAQGNISPKEILQFKIPLPNIEIQEQIGEEIENYSHIIESANNILDTYKPNFRIDSKWDSVELSSVTDFVQGINTAIDKLNYVDDGIKVLQANNIFNGTVNFDKMKYITKKEFDAIAEKYKPSKEDILYSNIGARFGYASSIEFHDPFTFSWNVMRMIIKDKTKLDKYYLVNILNTDSIRKVVLSKSSTSTMPFISGKELKQIKIPLPPIDIQKEIVAQIEEERKLVDSNKKLIGLFEKKIKNKIAEVWGE